MKTFLGTILLASFFAISAFSVSPKSEATAYCENTRHVSGTLAILIQITKSINCEDMYRKLPTLKKIWITRPSIGRTYNKVKPEIDNSIQYISMSALKPARQLEEIVIDGELQDVILNGIENLHQLRVLKIRNKSKSYDQGLSAIGHLNQLRVLHLEGFRFQNENEIATIFSKLENLEELQLTMNVVGNDIEVGGLNRKAYITNLHGLRSLRTLKRLTVTNKLYDIDAVSSLTSLEEVSLSAWKTSFDVRPLSSLKNLKKLHLSAGNSEYVASLGALTQLETLRIFDLNQSPQFIRNLPNLKKLEMSFSVDNDYKNPILFPDLSPIASLSQLELIKLSGIHGNCSLEALNKLKTVKSVSIRFETNFSPACLNVATLAHSLPQITALEITGPSTIYIQGQQLNYFSDAEMATLTSLKNLTRLNLTGGITVFEENMKYISKLRSLESLSVDLGNFRRTDSYDSYNELSKLTQLRALVIEMNGGYLDSRPFDIRILSRMSRLEFFSIVGSYNTSLDGPSMLNLARQNPSLKEVLINEDNINLDDLAQLKQMAPNLRVSQTQWIDFKNPEAQELVTFLGW